MEQTAQLGIIDSQLANIEPGIGISPNNTIAQSISKSTSTANASVIYNGFINVNVFSQITANTSVIYGGSIGIHAMVIYGGSAVANSTSSISAQISPIDKIPVYGSIGIHASVIYAGSGIVNSTSSISAQV